MRRSDAVIVLQARLASKRLPGKALHRIDGDSIVVRCLKRLLASDVAPVILATTTCREDDALVEEADSCGVLSVRGSADDVLSRFALVTELVQPQFVVRATADNPAVDIEAPGRVLERLQADAIDYVVENDLPFGCAVEGMRAQALLDAAERATEPYDREHVTPFLRNPAHGYRAISVSAAASVCRPDLRFTVDTPEDLEWIRQVYAQAGAGAATLPLIGLIRAADRLRTLKEVA
jgi:spore coat polysaccharide biosynthesis protein SpsF